MPGGLPAIPLIGNLAPLPSPAVGVPSGGGFLGGIGDAAQSFGQGLQQGEELQEKRRNNALQRIQLLQQQVAADPTVAKNPNWANQIKALYKQAGVAAPLDAQGNINVNALSPKPKLAEVFAKDPTALAQAQAMTPESRHAIYGAGAYDTTGIDPSFFSQPAHYMMSAGERTYVQRGLNDDLKLMAQGNLTVPQFLSWVDMNKDNLTAMGMDPNKILQSNPDVLGKLGATTQAKIQEMEQLGILRKDQAIKAIAEVSNLQSLEDLRRIQGRYYQARADAIPRQLALRQYQVMSSISLREQSLGLEEQRLQNAMANTSLRGLGLRLQAANQLRQGIDAHQRDYNNLLNIAKGYTTGSTPSAVPQSVIDQLKEAKQRIDADKAMISGVQDVQTSVGDIKITAKPVSGSAGTQSMAFLKTLAAKYHKPLGEVVKEAIQRGFKVVP